MVEVGIWAGGGCNVDECARVVALVALLVGGLARGGYRSGAVARWKL